MKFSQAVFLVEREVDLLSQDSRDSHGNLTVGVGDIIITGKRNKIKIKEMDGNVAIGNDTNGIERQVEL